MLGDTIRELRIRRNLTQAEVADRAGVTRPWLSRVEGNAIFTPDPRKLQAVATILDADIDALFVEAGYSKRDLDSPSDDDLTIDEIISRMNRLADQLRKRTEPTPIRPADRRDGTDPSVRRFAHARSGDLVLASR